MPDKALLRSTKGMSATPLRYRRSPHRASERRWLRGDGSSLIPKVRVGFPAEVCESE